MEENTSGKFLNFTPIGVILSFSSRSMANDLTQISYGQYFVIMSGYDSRRELSLVITHPKKPNQCKLIKKFHFKSSK
jgi:hypothetical protein